VNPIRDCLNERAQQMTGGLGCDRLVQLHVCEL
jgi:hypothetical protein